VKFKQGQEARGLGLKKSGPRLLVKKFGAEDEGLTKMRGKESRGVKHYLRQDGGGKDDCENAKRKLLGEPKRDLNDCRRSAKEHV